MCCTNISPSSQISRKFQSYISQKEYSLSKQAVPKDQYVSRNSPHPGYFHNQLVSEISMPVLTNPFVFTIGKRFSLISISICRRSIGKTTYLQYNRNDKARITFSERKQKEVMMSETKKTENLPPGSDGNNLNADRR